MTTKEQFLKGKRGRYIGGVTLGLVLALGISFPMPWRLGGPKNYSRLMELIKHEDKEGPLLVFRDLDEGFDAEIHKANLQYLQEERGLLRKIQKDLDGGEIRWRLEGASQRLMFVPEVRQEYASLYQSYCHDIIEDILDATGLDNPYRKIGILLEERPDISDTHFGIEVFLVHNLAKESVSTYAFSNQEEKSVRMDLRSRQFTGEVGSFSTDIFIKEDGTFEFERAPYAIWQDSARIPYTALMVPAEETIHIALREHTEAVIKEDLQLKEARDPRDVKEIAEKWMAVEEAAVGGCVRQLLPGILKKYIPDFPESMIDEDLQVKGDFERYRHLVRGIEVVKDLGCENAINVYKEDPKAFRGLLSGLGGTTVEKGIQS